MSGGRAECPAGPEMQGPWLPAGPPLAERGGAARARSLSGVRRWELTDPWPRDAALHLGTTAGLELPESVQRCARPCMRATPGESLRCRLGAWTPQP